MKEPPPQKRYRDELNFAEFPLASISDRLPPEQKTLTFEDQITDRGRGEPVTRRLTISASEKYGLPTALDDEVILGLLQLSSAGNFEDRKVHFTRYELIKALGWRDESRSYQRVAKSLKRWLGVTLYYDKAWWSKDEQAWVSEHFHILDNVTILDQQRRRRRLACSLGDSAAGQSSFTWNEVVFESFRSGYLKQLDMDLFRSLKSRIAKRVFRFLDKRFYRQATVEFELRTFAFEHIGLSRNYNTAQIRRKLAPAFQELEEVGFLAPMDDGERFVKKARGLWNITLRQGSSKGRKREAGADPALVAALEERGISSNAAARLVSKNSPESVRKQLEVFDWLVSRGDSRVSKNPPGYLYKAISDAFEPPSDYEKPRVVREEKRRVASRQARVVRRKDDREELDAFWTALPTGEHESFERAALKAARPFLAKLYRESKPDGGIGFNAARQTIIDDHIRRHLANSAA